MSGAEIMENNVSQLQEIEDLAIECLADGIPLSVIKNYSDDEIEAVYNVAYNLYQQHQYEDAKKLFTFLVLHEHADSRFSIGLGGCYQLMGQYDKAIIIYSTAAVIDATNPMPAFHACECYMALKDWDNAKKAVTSIEIICVATADEADHSGLLKKVAAMFDLIDERAAGLT